MAHRRFIEGIFTANVQKAFNGVEYMDIVPNDYDYNALGERSDPMAGCLSGPVVVRPIYHGIYEEIQYRRKFHKSSFHCITGTPGSGNSFMAPFLAKKFMEDDPEAIVAYWN